MSALSNSGKWSPGGGKAGRGPWESRTTLVLLTKGVRATMWHCTGPADLEWLKGPAGGGDQGGGESATWRGGRGGV